MPPPWPSNHATMVFREMPLHEPNQINAGIDCKLLLVLGASIKYLYCGKCCRWGDDVALEACEMLPCDCCGSANFFILFSQSFIQIFSALMAREFHIILLLLLDLF